MGRSRDRICWRFQETLQSEGKEIYSTMSETEAAFAEGIIRSLKRIMGTSIFIYYLNLLQQWILKTIIAQTWNPTTSRTLTLCQKFTVKLLGENKKPKLGTGDRARISKYDLPSSKGYKPQFTQEIFGIVAIATKKPPTYKIKDDQEETIPGKFYEKEMIRVIWVWIRLQSS